MKRPVPERPRPDQESVWDYPRPPRLERTARRIRAVLGGVTLADSVRAFRVLETSHPPTYYVPPEDVRMDLLVRGDGTSICEWKGQAVYHDALVEGGAVARRGTRPETRKVERLAWSYPRPTRVFEPIRDHLAFFLPALDAGYVDDELAEPQPGGFYGGWITADLAGPFKGVPGSWGW